MQQNIFPLGFFCRTLEFGGPELLCIIFQLLMFPIVNVLVYLCVKRTVILIRRAKLGQIQGGGVAEGHPRYDKGGGGGGLQ